MSERIRCSICGKEVSEGGGFIDELGWFVCVECDLERLMYMEEEGEEEEA